jgi:hypothetical protein
VLYLVLHLLEWIAEPAEDAGGFAKDVVAYRHIAPGRQDAKPVAVIATRGD